MIFRRYWNWSPASYSRVTVSWKCAGRIQQNIAQTRRGQNLR
nr:MAG TPA: hypothetical protein [Caudoviricetes sp.]